MKSGRQAAETAVAPVEPLPQDCSATPHAKIFKKRVAAILRVGGCCSNRYYSNGCTNDADGQN
jgi:hypothetical protein